MRHDPLGKCLRRKIIGGVGKLGEKFSFPAFLLVSIVSRYNGPTTGCISFLQLYFLLRFLVILMTRVRKMVLYIWKFPQISNYSYNFKRPYLHRLVNNTLFPVPCKDFDGNDR